MRAFTFALGLTVSAMPVHNKSVCLKSLKLLILGLAVFRSKRKISPSLLSKNRSTFTVFNPANVRVKACLEFRGDKRSAFFRAENAMHQIADV